MSVGDEKFIVCARNRRLLKLGFSVAITDDSMDDYVPPERPLPLLARAQDPRQRAKAKSAGARRAAVAARPGEQGGQNPIQTPMYTPNEGHTTWTQYAYAEGALWGGWRNATEEVSNSVLSLPPGTKPVLFGGPNGKQLPAHDSPYNGPGENRTTEQKRAQAQRRGG